MRNIELKARLGPTCDLAAAEETAKRLAGGKPPSKMRQRDTYFNVPEGRLKLRETTGSDERAELIFYRRPDGLGAKRSEYEIARVDDPGGLRDVLAAALGVRCVVEKRRVVYLWRPGRDIVVRIHLDRLRGLGSFLEFEAVMPEGVPDAEGEALLKKLMGEFGVAREDIIAGSYADMIEGA